MWPQITFKILTLHSEYCNGYKFLDRKRLLFCIVLCTFYWLNDLFELTIILVAYPTAMSQIRFLSLSIFPFRSFCVVHYIHTMMEKAKRPAMTFRLTVSSHVRCGSSMNKIISTYMRVCCVNLVVIYTMAWLYHDTNQFGIDSQNFCRLFKARFSPKNAFCHDPR